MQMVLDAEEDSVLLPFFFIFLFLRQYGRISHMDAKLQTLHALLCVFPLWLFTRAKNRNNVIDE